MYLVIGKPLVQISTKRTVVLVFWGPAHKCWNTTYNASRQLICHPFQLINSFIICRLYTVSTNNMCVKQTNKQTNKWQRNLDWYTYVQRPTWRGLGFDICFDWEVCLPLDRLGWSNLGCLSDSTLAHLTWPDCGCPWLSVVGWPAKDWLVRNNI